MTALMRIIEPELMDSEEDARQYDAMDHAAVNTQFAIDLLTAVTDWSLQRPVVLDLGAGTAQIPIELARQAPLVQVTAIDAAECMLAVARTNVADAGFGDRIELVLADAKNLPFANATFPVVISNSIIHHIAEPRHMIAEAIRVTAPGGLLFHRDLCRPHDETELERIVDTYASDATPYQRMLFADSLRAALTIAEMQQLVSEFAFAPNTVCMTSDRHWSWIATKC